MTDTTISKFIPEYKRIMAELKDKRAFVQRAYIAEHETLIGCFETPAYKSIMADMEHLENEYYLWKEEAKDIAVHSQEIQAQVKAENNGVLNLVKYRQAAREAGLDKRIESHNQRVPKL